MTAVEAADGLWLTDVQADVVKFLSGLPGAYGVTVRSVYRINPATQRTSHELSIDGGGQVALPCHCGQDGCRRDESFRHGSATFIWKRGQFSHATAGIGRRRLDSIVQAKAAIERQLGLPLETTK